MEVKDLIKQYLSQVNVMQLATADVNSQPWACTIHYYSDDDFNFYWISTLARKHSEHIKQNPKVAAAILVHENTAEEPYVVGISIEGIAELVGENIDQAIGEAYVKKHAKNENFLPDIASGKNPHKFYKLTPSSIVLFDSKNFPDNPRQEWRLS